MPREILVDWTGPQGNAGTNVLFFDQTTATVAAQRTALQTFLTSWKANLSNQYAYIIRTTGRDLDSATGALVAAWSDASAKIGTGNVAAQPVADATQVLFQWHTGAIVGGRFVRGRTFFPGLTASSLASGNITPAFVPTFAGYGTTLIAAAVGLGVWHRPKAGSGGDFKIAGTCSVWPELAVLRRRRH